MIFICSPGWAIPYNMKVDEGGTMFGQTESFLQFKLNCSGVIFEQAIWKGVESFISVKG